MSDLRFTRDHEWIAVEGDIGTVGITQYAQKQLGDIVFVELPESGQDLAAGGEAAVVESVKAASEVFSPVDGAVTEANTALVETPALVNQAPETDGWFFKLRLSSPDQIADMMDRAAYDAFVATLD